MDKKEINKLKFCKDCQPVDKGTRQLYPSVLIYKGKETNYEKYSKPKSNSR